jgi:hypothetical protein
LPLIAFFTPPWLLHTQREERVGHKERAKQGRASTQQPCGTVPGHERLPTQP